MKKTLKKAVIETVIVRHNLNGFEEDAEKFVEIEGKKYVQDPNDPAKAKLGDDGKPVEFVEKKKDDNTPDVSKMTLEELGEKNPAIKGLLEKMNGFQSAEEERRKKEEEEAEKKAKEAGEYDKVIADKDKKLSLAGEELKKSKENYDKAKNTLQVILDKVTSTIPEDKRGLVPSEFSTRQKLEYIMANAEVLGADVSLNKGGEVKNNDNKPNLSEEATLAKEVNEMLAKETLTQAEQDILWQKSVKLKELRAQNAK